MPLLECSSVEQLRRELSKNRDLRKICGFNDYDYYFDKNKVRGLKKATIMIDIMMIGMMRMAKGHIINKQPENLRKLKSV